MKLLSAFAVFAVAVPFLACSASEESSAASTDDLTAGGGGAACKLAKPTLPVACAELYDPVCGCDGKTYGNACEASAVVTSTTPGACPTKADAGAACKLANPTLPVNCAQIYDPVCGCDGKTYGNACEASSVVTSTTPGACPPATDAGAACKLGAPRNVFCPAVYDPVCGCDGKTYGNACEAGRVVASFTPDACP